MKRSVILVVSNLVFSSAAALLVATIVALLVACASPPAPRVVMAAVISSCGRYVGMFAVTSDGHWRFVSEGQGLTKSQAQRALSGLPGYAQAYLDPTDKYEGDCPPSIKTGDFQ